MAPCLCAVAATNGSLAQQGRSAHRPLAFAASLAKLLKSQAAVPAFFMHVNVTSCPVPFMNTQLAVGSTVRTSRGRSPTSLLCLLMQCAVQHLIEPVLCSNV